MLKTFFSPMSPALRGFLAITGLFGLLITSHVLYEVYLDCTLYYDLGIYTEGIRQLGPHNLNPWISARQIHLFADHFDPMVWLAAPWTHVIDAPYGLVIFESLFLCLGVAPLFWLQHKNELSARNASLLGLMVLFNLGTVTAAHYPVHPTTWAMTPWLWLVVALDCRRFCLAFVSFVALLMCKEEFPFVAPLIAALLWHQRERRWAAAFSATGVGWLVLVYGIRPHFVGPVESYWSAPFADLSQGLGLWPFLYRRITDTQLIERGPLMLAPIIWLGLLLWQRGRTLPAWGYMALVMPPLALRFLAWRWAHQYHAVTVVACLAAFLPALRRVQLPRHIWAPTMALLLATNYISVRGAYALATEGSDHRFKYCPSTPGRIASLKQARAIIADMPQGRLVSEMNLLPKLTYRRETYQVGSPKELSSRPYHVAFFEKPPNGCCWPTQKKYIAELIACWRTQNSTEILLDDDFVFLARGIFYDN